LISFFGFACEEDTLGGWGLRDLVFKLGFEEGDAEYGADGVQKCEGGILLKLKKLEIDVFFA
jgi:hypothetical protein